MRTKLVFLDKIYMSHRGNQRFLYIYPLTILCVYTMLKNLGLNKKQPKFRLLMLSGLVASMFSAVLGVQNPDNTKEAIFFGAASHFALGVIIVSIVQFFIKNNAFKNMTSITLATIFGALGGYLLQNSNLSFTKIDKNVNPIFVHIMTIIEFLVVLVGINLM